MSVAPSELEQPATDEALQTDRPWACIVWDDPVNLMSYVTFVFVSYFHYSREKAAKLMLQVHNDGKAAVATGTREEMERDVQRLHEYGLWATVQRDDEL